MDSSQILPHKSLWLFKNNQNYSTIVNTTRFGLSRMGSINGVIKYNIINKFWSNLHAYLDSDENRWTARANCYKTNNISYISWRAFEPTDYPGFFQGEDNTSVWAPVEQSLSIKLLYICKMNCFRTFMQETYQHIRKQQYLFVHASDRLFWIHIIQERSMPNIRKQMI